ncbi:M24 family metallopeptidase [Cohnella rhizosphaerae]|uniref:Xaa-Pro peptidase family protein n=1 Tax=Cohnella rhizosphaerae TaxID=1457232 RepID=A0A9X4QVF9_9BACL|nr:Xaa-Pro peptidase family protein [Cohnella rhizosphaerae]MDG0811437.1 Xaa-Pro peptidase family protein [Cohnella rhizosphaerae]
MDYSVNREKMEQASGALREREIDMWLILTSEGSDPCLPLVTGVRTVGPGAFLILADGRRYALCSAIDAQDIEESGLFDEVYKYAQGLDDTLRETVLRLAPSRIALNYSAGEHLCDGLTLGRYRWLMETLKHFEGEFISSEPFLTELRSIKTPEEIRRTQKAIDITLDIYDAVFGRLKAGMTEQEAGALFLDEMQARGVVNGLDRKLSMPMVLKENISHRQPSDRVIAYGDLVIFDYSVDYEGYVSDIARTVYFLRPDETDAPDDAKYAFQAAYDAISAAQAALKPGAIGHEVDGVARRLLLDRGMPEISHATGHQIGRQTHDGGTLLAPRWERYGQAPYGTVRPGMIFTLEPTILPGKPPYILLEENLVVTETGSAYLSVRQERLALIRS